MTAGFALAMALVIAAAGLFVYLRMQSSLSESIETVRGVGYRLKEAGSR